MIQKEVIMNKENEQQIPLVLIRHGMTPSNGQHRYLGRTEEHLSAEGIQALKEYQKQGFYPKVSHLFSSPMLRCLETAEILYPDIQPVLIPEWREMDFGDFEGKNYMELSEDPRYQSWIDSNGTLPFPGGESREAFICRSLKGMELMAEQIRNLNRENSSFPDTVGLIVHGGTIMALLSSLAGGDYYDYQIKNAEGYRCVLFSHGTDIRIRECVPLQKTERKER